jgi:gliding motility-associated-like protein
VLYFSAEEAAEVTVTVNNTIWKKIYHVPAHSVIASDNMPQGKDATEVDSRLYVDRLTGGVSEGLFTSHGIHIVSNVPIVAYAHSIAQGSSGATMLMPVDTWGYNYLSVNSNQTGGHYSWAFVVANHDNTKVEITPAVKTIGGKQAGQPFSVLLNKGQIYQVLGELGAAMPSGGGGGIEMSGARFRSVDNGSGQCYPIGVFSGSSSTMDSMSCGYGYLDADMQQVFPTHAWGKRYLTAPTSREDKPAILVVNAYKVLVNDITTVVKVNGRVLTGLKKNYYYFESNTADLIEADKPVMVAQFIPGAQFSTCNGSNLNSDPDMIYISPVDQGINKIGFFRNNRQNIKTTYLTLLVPNGGTGLSSLRIDGLPLSGLSASEFHSYIHPKMAGYTVVVRRWSGYPPFPAPPPGQCMVYSDSAFTAVTYGLGEAESYAYNAGTHIYNLDARGSIHNTLAAPSQQNTFTCVNTPVSISALIAYKPTQIVWKLSALPGAVTPSADVTDNAPVPVETVTINGGVYYKYTLPGDCMFNTADTFYLPIVLTSQEVQECDHTEELKLRIEVRKEPAADFSFTRASNCALDTVYLTAVTNTTDGYTLQTWNWRFPDAATATGVKAKRVLAAGIDQPVTLSAVTMEGCVADTTKKFTVYAPPVADFNATTTSACEQGNYSFSGTATYEGSVSLQWHWLFGNGNTQTTTNNSTSPEIYNEAGDYTVKLVVKANELCISDTIRKVVTVYAKPKIAISYPAGCLPKDGLVTFTNNSTLPNGQTINSHQWNFGDANATPANPNTSTLASPSHRFTAAGNYNITYQAVSEKGCIKDTVIKAAFNPAPVFTYDALTPVCENAAAFSVAKASVTNGVTGTGLYKGPGTTGTGLFTPATAGAGLPTIWYVYTTTLGCIDSVSQTIQVYPAPVASYTFVNNTCVGEPTTFTPTATVSSGDVITRWSWDFGNGNQASKTTAEIVKQAYATYGSYTTTLTVTTNHNCTSISNEATVTVQPLPNADFAAPDTICLPGGAAYFTNKSSIPSNDALTYSWDFGDGTGSFSAVNPSHVYARSGNYNVQLTASSAYGCKDAANKPTDKFYDRPIALFTATPREICQGANIVFKDGSTAAGSTVTNWSWNFGDGTTATSKTPAKVYKEAGGFSVGLVVKSAQGCVSAPAFQPITVHQQPVIDAGPSFNVKEGTQVQFNASANAGSYTFQWQPVTGLSNPADLRPYLKVTKDLLYTLTATGDFNCTATDTLRVKLQRNIEPPNAFTPNGDGIHDVWEIAYLSDYMNVVVDVFNRYGQNVYHVQGYGSPWDGRMNGKDLPAGTYYYIINLGNGGAPLSGPVTIIR